MADFPSETMEAWKEWNNIFKVLVGGWGWGHCQPKILYQVKISFKNESELERISGKEKLRIHY